jgi:hypothetical protein
MPRRREEAATRNGAAMAGAPYEIQKYGRYWAVTIRRRAGVPHGVQAQGRNRSKTEGLKKISERRARGGQAPRSPAGGGTKPKVRFEKIGTAGLGGTSPPLARRR